MNNSGDAAEQVVRLSLEGTEVALKLTGSAAKNIAAAESLGIRSILIDPREKLDFLLNISE